MKPKIKQSMFTKIQKVPIKLLLTLVFILLASIVFLLRLRQKPETVEAGWWNDSWHYRQPITTTNGSAYSATDVPYRLIVDTQTLISSNKMQSDADDIRIVDKNGDTIRYQVELSTLNTTQTGIWLEADVPANSSEIYYIYYGNPSASAPDFDSDVTSVSGDGETVEMIDGFGYSTSTTHARVSDVRKDGTNLGVNGNYHHTTGYPGNWWDDRSFTKTLLASGPLFVEVKFEDTNYGSYSSLGTNIKMFKNGFVETRLFMNYNTSGTDTLYYYLHFDNDTRNSVWIDGSEVLSDIDANSGTLYQANLGDNWFGQRWTATGYYGGTIVRKNNSDWTSGATSTRASYYQTNYSNAEAYTSGVSREIRYGIFAGDGGLSEMTQKGSSYGDATTSLGTEQKGTGPIAHWDFNEGAGSTAHDVIGGNYGIISNSVWKIKDNCVSGGCLYFDGTADNVAISSPVYISPDPGFTITHWIKTSSSSRQVYTIGNAGGGNGYRFGISSGRIAFLVGNSGAYTETTCGTKTVNDNQWHTITGVVTTSTFTCYIDGEYEATANISDYTGMSTVAPGIGAPPCCTDFAGYIDEPKFFDYPLTPDQIKVEYNRGAGVAIGVGSTSIGSTTPIAHWNFNEGAGSTTHDVISSNHGNFGTGGSTPSWTQDGKNTKALVFDGVNSLVDIPNIPNELKLITSSTFTISAWINPSATTASVYYPIVANQRSTSLFFGLYGNSPRLGLDDGFMSSGAAVNTDEWSHVVVTYDGGTTQATFYVDGKQYNTATNSDIASSTYTNLYIGYESRWPERFVGKIDEVKVFNYALTPEEIAIEYNRGSALSLGASQSSIDVGTTNLVAEWKFEEGVGTTTYDTSGNSNNGVFGAGSSAPTWTTGKIGKALNFNGTNDYLDISDLTLTGQFTYSFWINSNDTGTRMWSSGTGSQKIGTVGGNFFVRLISSSDNTVAFPSTNTWHHIVITRNSDNKVDLFVNGGQPTRLFSDATQSGDTYLQIIGRANDGSGQFYQGKIDNIKIFNTALTPAQIAWEYNQGAPVGHWRLDEKSGLTAYDSSGLGNTGTLGSGDSAPTWITGKLNNAASFDGNDRIAITTTNIINPSQGSVSLWVKPNGNQASPAYVFSHPQGGDNSRIYIDFASGGLSIDCRLGNATTIGSYTLTNNTWTHILCNWNGTSASFYVNGINKTTTSSFNGLTSAAATSYIGIFSTSQAYNGLIDDIRIYNYALTDDQIKNLYNGGSAIKFN